MHVCVSESSPSPLLLQKEREKKKEEKKTDKESDRVERRSTQVKDGQQLSPVVVFAVFLMMQFEALSCGFLS